ncbi:hypothetical protein CF394_06820 [Tetzosporium hominis]|uniref:DUF4435 domain-containing protein n=1 Tax=Tetzosporium hominis TaxID=2020506 RepID=A0A264W4E0_9BACL|nr:DUF3226 domain-containing protein [Tetzosporium hominis]OZS78463.1 hypothetical protein CF394_06820 [Tetzosporium hominis]
MPQKLPDNQGEILKSKLILVEGNDEVNFFEALIKSKGISDDLQIINIEGISNLKTKLAALVKVTGFSENVESVAIVRDADENFDSAFQSVCGILKSIDLPYPTMPNNYSIDGDIKVGVFIMPGDPNFGAMLEDLCIVTQQDNVVMECVDNFFSCLETKSIETPKNISKARCQVYLGAMPNIVSSVGVGAKKGYWNFEHPAMDILTNFISDL